MDDVRIGRSLRALRLRRGLTQAELAAAGGVSQAFVSLIERGHLDAVAIRTVRRLFARLDARFEGQVTWRGGRLDRLTDEAHAQLVGLLAQRLRETGWQILIEASYSVYGERGSIDVLAARPRERAAFVGEVKSELASLEELVRKTDEKVRLVRTRLCRERFGFAPAAVGRVLILPDTDAARRRTARVARVLDAPFPGRTREVGAWLRRPVGDLGGVLFLADTNRRGTRADPDGRRRPLGSRARSS